MRMSREGFKLMNPRLIIRLHGQETGQLELIEGQEYIAGRADECAIVLKDQKGISRQHFKICQRDGVWMAESLSRFVPLQKDGEVFANVELKKETTFYAPPYEFIFVPEQQADAPNVLAPTNEEAPVDKTVVRGLEATAAGVVYLVPYLRIKYSSGEVETLKLEGDLWTAGREATAEINLKNSRVSRRHLEISRTRDGFFVTDLGSSNGTKLNGQKIPADEPTRLDSGDRLEVLDVEMQFEIRDLNISNKLQALPQDFNPLVSYNSQPQAQPLLPGSVPLPPPPAPDKYAGLKNFNWKKNWVRVVIGGLTAVFLIFLFIPDKKHSSSRGPANDKVSPNWANLSADQKQQVKDTFNLARSLYMDGKYELCLAEIARLHDLVRPYENSEEINAYCEQGRELKRRQDDEERRRKLAEENERKMQEIINSCKETLAKNANVEETTKCLAEAIAQNPNHPGIAEMISNAQAREDERKLLAAAREARDKKTARGQALYHHAKELVAKGQLARAIEEYDRFISTPYPNLDAIKSIAKREVSSIKKELQVKVTKFSSECKTLGDKGKFKEAYLACDSALKEDPNNESVRDMRGKMLASLRRELKSIYEDSVIEESMGNVDSAKEKWRKIVSEDLDFDEYSKKAKILLKKHGIE